MSEASPGSLKPTKWGRHVDTSDANNVSRGALSGSYSLSYYLQSSWDMSNGNLIRRFLDLDFLVAEEPARLDLHDKLALGLVLDALVAGALYLGIELSGVDDLVDLKATDVASVDSHLDARLHITGLCDNSLHIHQ